MNVTACPPTVLPEPSVTVALMMVVVPAVRDAESAVKLKRYAVEELDALVIRITFVAPLALTCILSSTAVLGLLDPAV